MKDTRRQVERLCLHRQETDDHTSLTILFLREGSTLRNISVSQVMLPRVLCILFMATITAVSSQSAPECAIPWAAQQHSLPVPLTTMRIS